MARPVPSEDAPVTPRQRRRLLAATVGRIIGVTALATGLYLTAPLDRSAEGGVLLRLLLAMVVLLVVLGWEIRAILRSPVPSLRGIEAVIVAVPVLLLPFASSYVEMSRSVPSSFSEPLSHLDGLYFTVTVFATVGFGDITAQTAAARSLVTVQMVVDLVLIGFVAKVLVGVVQERRGQLGRGPRAGPERSP